MATVGNVGFGSITQKIKELQNGTNSAETMNNKGFSTICTGREKEGSINFYPDMNLTTVNITNKKTNVTNSYYSLDGKHIDSVFTSKAQPSNYQSDAIKFSMNG